MKKMKVKMIHIAAATIATITGIGVLYAGVRSWGGQGASGEIGEATAEGYPGSDGREIVFRVYKDWMQWQYEGEEEWQDLYEVPAVEENPVLTLISNGGTLPEGALAEMEVPAGTAVALPTPTKEGAVFLGWFCEGGNEPVPLSYPVLKTQYLRAEWGETDYTLTYRVEGTSLESVTYEYGDTVELPTLHKAGYTFRGWCTKEDLSDEPIRTLPSTAYGNKILYPSFEPNAYTVTFHVDGEDIPDARAQVIYNEEYTLPVPSKEHYVFNGWFDSPVGGRALTDDAGVSVGGYAVAGDSKVYAQWSQKSYTVTFQAGEGVAVSPAEYPYGTVLTSLPETAMDGYLFKGWYLDAAQTEALPADYALTGDVTLYALYVESVAVSTPEELRAMALNPSGRYHLTSDINLNGEEWTPIPAFDGTLDGCGYRICNFSLNGNGGEWGFVNRNGGTIENLTLEDFAFSISVSGESFYAGVLAGVNEGVIQNCRVLNGVASFHFSHASNGGTYLSAGGGLVGKNQSRICDSEATVDINCSVSSTHLDNTYYNDLYVSLYIGGLVGSNEGELERCRCTADILSLTGPSGRNTYYGHKYVWSQSYVGGAVGNNLGHVTDSACLVHLSTAEAGESGDANAEDTAADYGNFGGFAAVNAGNIRNCSVNGQLRSERGRFTGIRTGGFLCYNHGRVSNSYAAVDQTVTAVGNADSRSGGFVYNNYQIITNCYATGSLESAVAAGVAAFAGNNAARGVISKCFASCEVTATSEGAWVAPFVATAESGSSLFKCYYDGDKSAAILGEGATPANRDGIAATTADFCGAGLVTDTLSWPSDVWYIAEGEFPILQGQRV